MDIKNKAIIFPLFLFFITIFTRIPFTSKYLYHMDSVQFALALEKYDITVHQPHPPGYFLYAMLGRFINLFIKDANSTLILISILFSGLAVVTIYYLGKEIFDEKTGILAALLALTSPNLWFHGEVALTYIVEAFFSAFVALFCWRILKGNHKYLWLSVIALGIAGGIRQNTIVFLFPLWLFSVKGVPLKKIMASIGLLGVICLCWFVPMVWVTGGWDTYNEALRELWEFNTGHVSVFEQGWITFKIFSLTLVEFVIYGVGAGIFILGIALYSLIRNRKLLLLDRQKTLFFLLWLMPALMFYLLIFIHPANPGYVLILLPALLILTVSAIVYMTEHIRAVYRKIFSISIIVLIVIINITVFLFTKYPVTHAEITTHDANLSILLDKISTYDPLTSVLFAEESYMFYGFRHIMYYLPEYFVYDADSRMSPNGEKRKTFGGIGKHTYLVDKIILPRSISIFVVLSITDDTDRFKAIQEVSVYNIENTDLYLITGDFKLANVLLPKLHVQFVK